MMAFKLGSLSHIYGSKGENSSMDVLDVELSPLHIFDCTIPAVSYPVASGFLPQ